ARASERDRGSKDQVRLRAGEHPLVNRGAAALLIPQEQEVARLAILPGVARRNQLRGSLSGVIARGVRRRLLELDGDEPAAIRRVAGPPEVIPEVGAAGRLFGLGVDGVQVDLS